MEQENLTHPRGQPNTVYFHGNGVAEVIVTTVAALWKAVHELTRLRSTEKPVYLVTIFGSARIKPGSESYQKVVELAERLTRLGDGRIGIVTGGGPGMMQAANEGVNNVLGRSEDHSIGLRIDLDFETGVNEFVHKVYSHQDFFSRLHQFVILADAYIVVEGGIGSLLELALVWQLLQVRKLYHTPFILLAPMWKALVEWATKWMIDEPSTQLASPADMQIPHMPETTDEAIELIRQDFDLWLRHQDELLAQRCPRPDQQ